MEVEIVSLNVFTSQAYNYQSLILIIAYKSYQINKHSYPKNHFTTFVALLKTI